MASEVLKLTAQIVMSHVSMTELTSAQLMAEVKEIYGLLVSLESAVPTPASGPEMKRPRKPRKVKVKLSEEARSVRDMEGPEVGDPDYVDFMEHREG
jgi:predicted transcriptional regulator